MIRILSPAQLAAAPGTVQHESRITPDKLAWCHVQNLSPFLFELQDDHGEVRGIVRWWAQAIVPLQIRTERLQLVVIGTTTLADPIAAGSRAVYIDVLEQKPEQVASLYT